MKKKIMMDVFILIFAAIGIVTILSTARARNEAEDLADTEQEQAVAASESNEDESQEQTQKNDKIGKYEGKVPLKISTKLLGDVNEDNQVNASDASIILQYSAAQGVRFFRSTDEELMYADINKDGKINASDAALILMYSAAEGVGHGGTTPESRWEYVLGNYNGAQTTVNE